MEVCRSNINPILSYCQRQLLSLHIILLRLSACPEWHEERVVNHLITQPSL